MSRAQSSKKGIFGFEGVMWIVRSLMLIFILLSLMFVTSSFIVRNLDTRLADSYVLMNLMYYSGDATALRDSGTGRVYPGIMNTGNAAKLEDKFSYNEGEDGPFIASKATVPVAPTVKEFFYLGTVFNDWNLLYLAGLTEGKGGVKKISINKKIIAVVPDGKANSDAKFEVVTKNV